MGRAEFIHISDVHYQKRYSPMVDRLTARTGVGITEQFAKGMAFIRGRYPRTGFFLLSGDLVHEGAEEEYQEFQRAWIEASGGAQLYAVPGNHDRDAFGAVFAREGDAPPFDSEHRHASGLRILAMDSRGGKHESGSLDEGQLRWLAEKLPPGSGRDTILLLHHTPHISGEEEFLTYQMENPTELYEVVKDSGLLAIFCGHTHMAYSTRFGDIPCYTAGSITHSIECGMDSMTLGNRTGFHRCVFDNGRLDVEYVDIVPEKLAEVTIDYSEFEEA